MNDQNDKTTLPQARDIPASVLTPKLMVVCAALFMLTLAGVALVIGRADTPSSVLDRTAIDVNAGSIYASSFPDPQGRPQSLGQWQHKLLVINFWATWCGPCKEEMPIFDKLQQKYAANGLQIIGIAADNALNIAKFEKSLRVSYPLLSDETRAIEFSRRLGNRLGLLPHTVIVRPGGEVMHTQIGIIDKAGFEAIIRQNLPK